MNKKKLSLKFSISLISLTFLLTGCVSTSQGKLMQAKIEQLDAQQNALNKEQTANRAEFELMVQQARSDVEQIQNVLKKATSLMERNSADFGADFERFQQEFADLRGKVETLTFNFNKMQEDLSLFKEDVDLRFSSDNSKMAANGTAQAAPVSAQELGSNPVAMLNAADQAYKSKNYKQAQELYAAFIATFPKDSHMAHALYYNGDCLLAQKKPRDAGKQFEKIVSSYARSDYIDDAYFKLGDVFVELGSCANAAKFYARLVKKYRKSPLVGKANARIKAIKQKKLCK